MQVTETLSDGLKRGLKITIPAADLESKMMDKLVEIKDQVRINGFRPGKVPLAHLKKTYGRSVMADIVQEVVTQSSQSALEERKERPAMQPSIEMTEDQDEANEILDGKRDLDLDVSYELMPEFEVGDLSGITIEKPVVEVDDKEVMDQIEQLGNQSRPYEEKKGKAKDGDRISMSYLGKVDGEAFEGGADENGQLVLGSGQFIPGFEEQLVGKKAGDETVVKEVAAPGELVIDDDFAKNLGLEGLDNLKEIIKSQINGQYIGASRQKVKRQLLDQLDEKYDFELPPTMLSQEFDGIWGQVEKEMEEAGTSFEDNDTTEEEARKDYSKIAERRVRLGLVLAEIGDSKEIQVTEDEMRNAVMQQASQFPGQEKEVFDFYQKNPEQLASLRAPIFEEKVVDYILELATVTEKTVTKEELLADDDEE